MEDRRQSERLKKRSAGLGGGAKQPKDRRTPRPRTRDSVGGVLGLTPNRSEGRNLQVARAADAAAAAAAKLEQLEVAERSARKERKSKKARYCGIDRARKDYSPKSRDSLAMFAVTNGALEDGADEDEDKKAHADMPPLDGSDDEAPYTDGEDSDVGEVSLDEKENGGDGSSVIATPGPIAEPNTDDKAFIKRSSESDSGHNTEDALRDDDKDYVPSEADGMESDDEDDDELPRRRYIPVAQAKAEAERAARAAYNAALQQVRTQEKEIQRLAMEAADRRFAEHIAKMQQDKLEEVAESDDDKPDDDDDDYYDDKDEDSREKEPTRKEKRKLNKKEKKRLKKQKKEERKERRKKKRKKKREKKKQKRK